MARVAEEILLERDVVEPFDIRSLQAGLPHETRKTNSFPRVDPELAGGAEPGPEQTRPAGRRREFEHAPRPHRNPMGHQSRLLESEFPQELPDRAPSPLRDQMTPEIDREAVLVIAGQNAADPIVLLHDQNSTTLSGQKACRGASPDPRTDDDRVVPSPTGGSGSRQRQRGVHAF